MPRARTSFKRTLLAGLLVLAVIAFTALGLWQVERRAWKLQLLTAVDQRVHAAATPGPTPSAWAKVTSAGDAYRHVRVRGTFLHDRETFVQAVTDRGPGFWVLTPLRTEAGWIVLVNRGFVPADRRDPATRRPVPAAGPQDVTGLLRISEPKGAFLRNNDPGADRWYSRDVAAIAHARRLGPVAPYFIDADAGPDPEAYPAGGLTVIAFPNNHAVYALTWFALAAMSVAGLVAVLRTPGGDADGL